MDFGRGAPTTAHLLGAAARDQANNRVGNRSCGGGILIDRLEQIVHAGRHLGLKSWPN